MFFLFLYFLLSFNLIFFISFSICFFINFNRYPSSQIILLQTLVAFGFFSALTFCGRKFSSKGQMLDWVPKLREIERKNGEIDLTIQKNIFIFLKVQYSLYPLYMSSYRQIVSDEMNLMKQLNQLDCMLPTIEERKESYPQLFDDDSSLFQPDNCFNEQDSEKKTYEQSKKLHTLGVFEQQGNRKKQTDIFQHYLDSLQINQFLRQEGRKSSKVIEGKDRSSLQCTFKPSILKKSSSIAEQLQPSFDRLTNSISKKKITKSPYKPTNTQVKRTFSKDRMERLSKPRALKTEAEEKSEPTFKPQLDKKSLEQMSSCYLDVAARNKLWLQQKEAKVKKLRDQEEEKKKNKQFTYAPKVKQYKGEKNVNLSKYTKDGIANYFERLTIAKQKTTYKQKNQNMKDSMILERRQSKTPQKQNRNINYKEKREKEGKKKRYQEAVQELHKKIMRLDL